MFAFARTAAGELACFEFGELLDPLDPHVPLEQKVRWIMEDYENRRDGLLLLSISQSVAFLTQLLREAGGDPARLIPLIRALGFLRSANGADALAPYLDHPSVQVRAETIASIGNIGSLELMPRLEPFLDSPDRQLRRAAIVALGRSLDRAMFARLEAAAGDDAELRAIVAQNRRRLDAVTAGDMRAYTEAVIETDEYEDLIRLVEVTWEYVRDILADPARNVVVRARAARLLGLTRRSPCGPQFVRVLADGSEAREVRLQAAIAAGRCRTKDAVPFLARVLQSGDAQLQAAAVAALGNIGASEALEPLLRAWGTERLRGAIRLALKRLCTVAGGELLSRLLRENQHWAPERIIFIDDALNRSDGYVEGALDHSLASAVPEARRTAILLLAFLARRDEIEAKLVRIRDSDDDPTNRELAGLAVTRRAKE